MLAILNILRSFVWGFTLPLRSVRLILSHRILLAWSSFPFLISILLYVFVIQKLQKASSTFLSSYYQSWGIVPDGWAALLLSLFTHLILFMGAVLTFTFVNTLIASPFNDFLAEKAERFSSPQIAQTHSFSLRQTLRLMWMDLFKTIAAFLTAILALIVSWVPVVGFFGFLLALLLVTFQFVSYPQTRRGLPLLQGLGFLKNYFCASLGFGLATSLSFSIPFISMLALPVAVVGGTLLFAKSTDSATPLT